MKKTIILTALALLGYTSISQAQKYLTKNGHIKFYSEAPLENIEAHNNQVNSAFNAETGDIVFKVLMKSFEFEQALMQEHFNENYIYSDQYPNATFAGEVTNIGSIDLSKPGTYDVDVTGDLTIKGITNEVSTTGTFTVEGEQLRGKSVFNVNLDDFEIKIPSAVMQNISETIEITVDVDMQKFEPMARK